MFIRLPSDSDMAWDRYIKPFSYGLWLAVAIAACAVSVCLALTNYGHERKQNLSVSAILFYIHACFCQQGQPQKSYFLTSKFLYIFSPVLKFHFSLSLGYIFFISFFVCFLPLHLEHILLAHIHLNYSISLFPFSLYIKDEDE